MVMLREKLVKQEAMKLCFHSAMFKFQNLGCGFFVCELLEIIYL